MGNSIRVNVGSWTFKCGDWEACWTFHIFGLRCLIFIADPPVYSGVVYARNAVIYVFYSTPIPNSIKCQGPTTCLFPFFGKERGEGAGG